MTMWKMEMLIQKSLVDVGAGEENADVYEAFSIPLGCGHAAPLGVENSWPEVRLIMQQLYTKQFLSTLFENDIIQIRNERGRGGAGPHGSSRQFFPQEK